MTTRDRRLANRCTVTSPHSCFLGRHLIPDLTADPAGQSPVARLLGGLFLLLLIAAAGMVPGQ